MDQPDGAAAPGMAGLRTAIADIRGKLRAGAFTSEDQVSKAVVMRLLQQLGWDVFHPALVSSEFRIGKRKVDYALRHEPFGAVVLIEVKSVGNATSKGEDQLFDYCSKQGVPLAVLTDGRYWNFYFPAGMGNYEQRRFAVADLLADDAAAGAATLGRYLGFSAVVSGASQRDVQQDYAAYRQQILARNEFEGALESLVVGADARMVALFGDEVARRCGIRPDEGDIRNYLRNQVLAGAPEKRAARAARRAPRPASAAVPPEPAPAADRTATEPSFTLYGSTVPCKSDAEVLAGVLTALGERDPGVYELLAPHFAGRTRKLLSRDRNGLYPPESSEHVRRSVARLPGGWWVGTHSSTRAKHEQLKRVREVTRLSPSHLRWEMKGKASG